MEVWQTFRASFASQWRPLLSDLKQYVPEIQSTRSKAHIEALQKVLLKSASFISRFKIFPLHFWPQKQWFARQISLSCGHFRSWFVRQISLSCGHFWFGQSGWRTSDYLLNLEPVCCFVFIDPILGKSRPGPITFLKVGLGISRTNADSQWNPVYNVFHRNFRCGNEKIRR